MTSTYARFPITQNDKIAVRICTVSLLLAFAVGFFVPIWDDYRGVFLNAHTTGLMRAFDFFLYFLVSKVYVQDITMDIVVSVKAYAVLIAVLSQICFAWTKYSFLILPAVLADIVIALLWLAIPLFK